MSGTFLDTRNIANFQGGQYLVWTIQGHVKITITNTATVTSNAVMSGIFFGGNSTVMDMQYTYTAGQNNGRITQGKDWVLGQTMNYNYDALNRLSAMSIVETGTGDQMSYDGFGNVTGMNGAAVWSHDPTTNRVNVSGWTYDGNGRVLTDPNGSYTWTVEGQMTNGGQYSYDPDGLLVKDGSGAIYVWSVQGRKLGTYSVSWNSGGTPTISVVSKIGYFKGKRIGVAQDRLGTVRWAPSAPTMNYRSYGAEQTFTQSGWEMFSTYAQIGPAMQFADQRMYNPQMGKFFSPDPGGAAIARRGKPLSWNRYLYANGDPVNLYDPAGTEACNPNDDDGCAAPADDNGDCDDPNGCEDQDGGGGGGGTSVNYSLGAISGYTPDGAPIIGNPNVTPTYVVCSEPGQQYNNQTGTCDLPVYGSNAGSGTGILAQTGDNLQGFEAFLGMFAAGSAVPGLISGLNTALAPGILYHFTSTEAAGAIAESGMIAPGQGLFGYGVYGSGLNSPTAAWLMGASSTQTAVPFMAGLGLSGTPIPGSYIVSTITTLFGSGLVTLVK